MVTRLWSRLALSSVLKPSGYFWRYISFCSVFDTFLNKADFIVLCIFKKVEETEMRAQVSGVFGNTGMQVFYKFCLLLLCIICLCSYMYVDYESVKSINQSFPLRLHWSHSYSFSVVRLISFFFLCLILLFILVFSLWLHCRLWLCHILLVQFKKRHIHDFDPAFTAFLFFHFLIKGSHSALLFKWCS